MRAESMHLVMPPLHRAEALSDAFSDVCLTSDVCLSDICGVHRT